MATAAERAAAKKAADEAAEATEEGTAEHPVDVASIPMQVPVALAWARVMGDVQKIEKSDKVKSGPAKYNYIGIDRAVDIIGPVLRKHGVFVIPNTRSIQHRTIDTKSGGTQHEVIVEMGFTIVGPMGDKIEGGAFGEAADSSDKATAQAQSVAFRVFLLRGLCIPTGDADPDENHIEHGSNSNGQAAAKPAEPDPAEAAAKDETAKGLGWKSDEDRAAAWRTQMENLNKLDESYKAEVLAWGKEVTLHPDTFSKDQLRELNDRIETQRITQQRDAEAAKKKLEEAFTTEDGTEPHTEQQSYPDDGSEPF